MYVIEREHPDGIDTLDADVYESQWEDRTAKNITKDARIEFDGVIYEWHHPSGRYWARVAKSGGNWSARKIEAAEQMLNLDHFKPTEESHRDLLDFLPTCLRHIGIK